MNAAPYSSNQLSRGSKAYLSNMGQYETHLQMGAAGYMSGEKSFRLKAGAQNLVAQESLSQNSLPISQQKSENIPLNAHFSQTQSRDLPKRLTQPGKFVDAQPPQNLVYVQDPNTMSGSQKLSVSQLKAASELQRRQNIQIKNLLKSKISN